MKIAILGADINNFNLGCQALTWSLLHILENIRTENSLEFEYFIFEANPDSNKTNELIRELELNPKALHAVHLGCITDPLRAIKYAKRNQKVFHLLKQCDIAFDVTRGDSFSDLYGTHVFNTFAYYKLYLERCKVPLVLVPQTYGPFLKNRNQKIAAQIFKNANDIFARDKISADEVKSLSGKDAVITTDVAFQLPYSSKDRAHEKIKVGINISGLLASTTKDEYNQNLSLNQKYVEFIKKLLEYLTDIDQYEIYLIPHVTNDVEAINQFGREFPSTCQIEYIDNPVKIKNVIADMDIFIGSRMHATIAALSSGVVTIPLAYSRKFKGVFELLDYYYTIDLNNELDEMLITIKQDIDHFETLKIDVLKAKNLIGKYNAKTNTAIKDIILKYYND